MHSLSDAEKCNAAIMCCVNCYRGFVFTLLFTVMHTHSLSTSACYHVLCKLYLGFYRVLKVQSNITLYYVWHTATAFLSGTQYKLGAGWHLKRCNKMLQLWFWWLVAVSPVESTTMKFTKTKCKTCQAKRPGSRTTMCRPIIFHRLCLDTAWQITKPWNTWWSMKMSAWIAEGDYKIIWSRTMHRKGSNQIKFWWCRCWWLCWLLLPTRLPCRHQSVAFLHGERESLHSYGWHMASSDIWPDTDDTYSGHIAHMTYRTLPVYNDAKKDKNPFRLVIYRGWYITNHHPISWLVYHHCITIPHQLLSSAVDCRLMYCPLVNPSVWHLLSPFNIFVTFLQNWQKLGNWIKRVLLRNLTDSKSHWELTWHSLEGLELTEMSQFARLWHLGNSTSDHRKSIPKTKISAK